MSSTPRLDAVRAWIESGHQGDIPWPQETGERWPDPPSWADPDIRLEAAVMAAASGARAELPVRYATVAGKAIPPPPGGPEFKHGKRHKPPKRRRRKEKP